MSAFENLDRETIANSVAAYDSLKKDISGFFETFVNQDKVVTKRDIEEFFLNKRLKMNGVLSE